MNNEEQLVCIRGLGKRFAKQQVLSGIDLEIKPGHIIGLLGPNSSGKSTLMRHMMGIYLPDTGDCKTLGVDARKLSSENFENIGYVHQEGELPGWMMTRELIRYVADHYSNWNTELETDLLKRLEIDINTRVSKLSPGQRQKLAVLLAVCFEPKLLILDEPASALDPLARREFLALLLELIQDQRRSIVISSHILSDIEKVVDHVIVLHHGHILRDCSFDELLEEYFRIELRSPKGSLPETLPLEGVLSWEKDSHVGVATIRNSNLDLEVLARHTGCEIKTLPIILEDIYPLVLAELSAGAGVMQ